MMALMCTVCILNSVIMSLVLISELLTEGSIYTTPSQQTVSTLRHLCSVRLPGKINK